MLVTPERLYFELGQLIAEMPELASGPITPEVERWLASANALIKSSGSLTEALQLMVACENLDGPLRARNAETITNILHRMFVKAEVNASLEVRGSVLLIGGNLDAYTAIGQLLVTATSDALLVEPDAAGRILADYAILAPERITVRLLADEAAQTVAHWRDSAMAAAVWRSSKVDGACGVGKYPIRATHSVGWWASLGAGSAI
jgi:hypothetical protein